MDYRLVGSWELVNKTTHLPIKVHKGVQAVVRRAGKRLQYNARAGAPVDTGALKASIGLSFSGAGMTATAHTPWVYGGFQEYGTSRNRPHPFMRPALAKVEPGFISELEALLK